MRRLVPVLLASLAVQAAAADSPLKQQITGLFREKKYAEAQAALDPLVAREPDNAEALFYLGETYLYRDLGEGAVAPLERAVALAPANSDYRRHLGDAYGLSAQQAGFFSKTGWALKCKAAYEKAVELDPKNLSARQSLLEFYRQAPGFAGGGMDLAYAEAAEIQRLDPVRGRLAYAGLYAGEKKFSQAAAIYDEILKGDPDNYAALYQLGRLAAIGGTDPDRGLAALRRCLALPAPADQPGFAPASWRVGNILEKKGDKAGARAAYEAAVKADPKFAPAADSLKKLD
jgi:tetratricopeptide (TPR) repeat protein